MIAVILMVGLSVLCLIALLMLGLIAIAIVRDYQKHDKNK
jgi:hypothetical protein